LPLTTSKTLFEDAMSRGYGVPAFNANCFEMIPAIIEAAERERSPLILQLGVRFLNFFPASTLAALALPLAEKADVPVCVHLDHGNSLKVVKNCLEAGFTSVMIDGSPLPFEENVAVTKSAVIAAEAYGIPIEGEIGQVKLYEDVGDNVSDLTDPDEAFDFAARTGVASIAVAVGNVHRMKNKTARLDFELIQRLRAKIGIPLVIHGSSGIADDDVKRAVSLGINKINVATEFNISFIKNAVSYANANPDKIFPMEFLQNGMRAVTDIARDRIRVVGANGKY